MRRQDWLEFDTVMGGLPISVEVTLLVEANGTYEIRIIRAFILGTKIEKILSTGQRSVLIDEIKERFVPDDIRDDWRNQWE